MPREACIIADNSLLAAFLSGKKAVDKDIVDSAYIDRVENIGENKLPIKAKPTKNAKKMSQNNPFANLGALDQMLYHDTAPTPKDVPSVIDKQPGQNAENSLLANQQDSKDTNQQTSKVAKKQTSKETNQQTSSKVAKKQTSKPAK